jgi:hypothetical protein
MKTITKRVMKTIGKWMMKTIIKGVSMIDYFLSSSKLFFHILDFEIKTLLQIYRMYIVNSTFL